MIDIVLGLQNILARVIRDGNVPKIKETISKILRSKICHAYSVFRVISASGSKTPGIKDTNRPTSQKEYETLISAIWQTIKKPNNYRASPLARIYLPKPNGSLRPISIPTYFDRALQHLFNIILDVFQEEYADPRSFGFRKLRSPGWAAKSIILTLWTRKSQGPPKFAIQLDIEKCFDKISHLFILTNVARVTIKNQIIDIIPQNIMKSWLSQGFFDLHGELAPQTEYQPTKEGVPQGGPISPTISNMVLNGIENCVKLPVTLPSQKAIIYPEDIYEFHHPNYPIVTITGCFSITQIQEKLRSTGFLKSQETSHANYLLNGHMHRYGWTVKVIHAKSPHVPSEKNFFSLQRFADDCIVFVDSQQAVNNSINQINAFLAPRGLRLSATKTKIVEIKKSSFRFVGFSFSTITKHGKHFYYNYIPSDKLKALVKRIKTILPHKKTYLYSKKKKKYVIQPTPSIRLAIQTVNNILRGWLNYYRCGNTSSQFSYLGFRLFHIFRKYLFFYMSKNSKYIGKKKKVKKVLLYQDMWKKYLLKLDKNYRWWGISIKENPNTGRYKGIPLVLINPKKISVSTPKIKLSLSAYHPDDRPKLLEKAVHWQWGLKGLLLQKSKGCCTKCGISLIEDYPLRIHHVLPLSLGGTNVLNNLKALCKPCHDYVTQVTKTKDLVQIKECIQQGILSPEVLNRI